ncbi:MAG TPA: hypothetical protein VK324_00920 [Tepidisphaeraceae bacterium]|nr:hypothetical protein [Tepidisphaeraceae bacterium]
MTTHAGSRLLRYLWASPTTLIGLFVVALTIATGGKANAVAGVIEAHGGVADLLLRRATPLRGGASAMTLGHVVIARDSFLLDVTRDHERVHVRQCERWGPLFFPAYLVASLIAWCRGEHFYRDNHFEREAYGDQP